MWWTVVCWCSDDDEKKIAHPSKIMESTRRIQKELKELSHPRSHYCVWTKTTSDRGPPSFMCRKTTRVYTQEAPSKMSSFLRATPFVLPKVTFVTRIFHSNISCLGSICIDLLKTAWSPAMTIGKVLLSIRSLMDDPNPSESGSLAPVADLYVADRETRRDGKKKWTKKCDLVAHST